MPSPSRNVTRRQFLRITASASALIAGGVGLAVVRGNQASPSRVQESRLLMGSVANLTILSESPEVARRAIRAAFDRMSVLESVFSRHRPDSQLSILNATGYLPNAHPDLLNVLQRAINFGDMTDGAFDITVEPLSRLYRDTVKAGRLPAPKEVALARHYVDYRQIAFEENGVRFLRSGMAATLDGIAKGYVIDQGVAELNEHGFANVMIEVGGDLSTAGTADGRSWQINILEPQTMIGVSVAQLGNLAMATSGDYLNSFTSDRILHHILNPTNGISPTELSSASVVAQNACDADALATAVMVMGKSKGFALISQLEGVEALTITKGGLLEHTAHFPI
jgi:thiamine biosynthesis lipoprotein